MASGGGSTTDQPTGCYKCGRTGHWSRDCPSKTGMPAPSPATGAGGGRKFFKGGSGRAFTGKFKGDRAAAGGGSNDTSRGESKGKDGVVLKEPRKRQKLTPELLISKDGLGYVLENMPRMVPIIDSESPNAALKNLKTLLEGYMHWHSRFVPYYGFSQFIEKVEKLGAAKTVVRHVDELRHQMTGIERQKGVPKGNTEAHEGSPTKDSASKAVPDPEASGLGADADRGSPSEEAPKNNSSAAPRKGTEEGMDPGLSPPDNDAQVPVNDEDFEDFYRQGVLESEISGPTASEGGKAAYRVQLNASPVRKFPSLVDGVETTPGDSSRSCLLPEETLASSASQGVNAETSQSDAMPPAKFPSLNDDSGKAAPTRNAISEAALARMEANRLQALERARARRAANEQKL